MTIIEQIKAEIERRMEQAKKHYDNAYSIGRCDAFSEMLNFIDSLKKLEKPMQEGLEEEIGAYFKDWYVDESDQGYSLKTPTGSAVMGHMKNVARHFAQWGAEHLKK